MFTFSRPMTLGLALLAFAVTAACGQTTAPAAKPAAPAAGFPIQVPDCEGRTTTFDRPATKIVTSNATSLEILFWLGAQDLVVGTGFPPAKGDLPDRFADAAAKVAPLGGDATGGAMRGISREQLLGSGADTYIEAWGALAGMADVATPEQLAQVGIKRVLLHSTACAGLLSKPLTDLSSVRADVTRLGALTGRAAQAAQVVSQMDATLAKVGRAVAGVPEGDRPSVFFFDYDAGTDAPTVPCNRQIANAVYTLAGARNAFADCADDFKKIGWEDVVKRDPDWIQIGIRNHGGAEADEKAFAEAERFLSTFAATRDLRAVKNRKFIRVRSEVTTTGGVRNADAVEKIASVVYPGRVPAGQ
ncbi:ABC transporter substrate-binding protein [Streptosporangium sp. NPDC000396]|uniref:ABC transporter substrate-binding protein n=1 Tax=Streptosporangium sp. NPDC000396 TaxID=3366185 RepID=UPI00368F6AC2